MSYILNRLNVNKHINEYLNSLDTEKRRELKEELNYNIEFKEEFSFLIYELLEMFTVLKDNKEERFKEMSLQFLKRKNKNEHVIQMYRTHINEWKNNNCPIHFRISILIEKGELYNDLIENLHQDVLHENKIKRKI